MVSVKLDFTTTSLKVSGDVLKSKAGRGLWMITMLKLFIRNYFDYSVINKTDIFAKIHCFKQYIAFNPGDNIDGKTN